jgi:hypothetical protein
MGREAYSQVVDIREVGTIPGFAGTAEKRSGRVTIGVTNFDGPPSKVLRDYGRGLEVHDQIVRSKAAGGWAATSKCATRGGRRTGEDPNQ